MSNSARRRNEALAPLAEAVRDQGGRAWLVGGCVRDQLLGHPLKDIDVEVHGVPIEDLERLLHRLGRVDAVGRSFGVFKLRLRNSGLQHEIDVSIPRRDNNSGPGHRGIDVQGDPHMGLDEAVRRRDLTVNALMIDLLTGELEDRVNGLEDLRAGVLRAVDSTTFLDDPLRALRVIQFAARTGFQPTDDLIELCRVAPLEELPAERIQAEWRKLLLVGTHLEQAFHIARRADLQRVFPERVDDPALDAEIQALVDARDQLPADGPRWALMLSAWLASTPEPAILPILDRLWMHTSGGYRVREQVLKLAATRDAPTASDADLKGLSTRCHLRLALLLRGFTPSSETWLQCMAFGILDDPLPPLLRGRDLAALGVRGGPEMGILLQRAYQKQIEGEFQTLESALGWMRATLAARGT